MSWSTVTVGYRGLASRRQLLTTWLPEQIDAIGATGDWFFGDTLTPTDPVDPSAAVGEIEIAIALGDRDPAAVGELLRQSLEGPIREGIATEMTVLPRPRLLDPVLFAGSTPSAVYTALLSEGTRRAIDILTIHEPPLSAVTSEVQAFLGLVGHHEQLVLADHYATWLELVATRRATTAGADAAAPARVVVSITTTEPPPLTDALRDAFKDEAVSLPRAHRYELVGRLAHIQAMRLDPTLSLQDEAALVRGLLASFAHRDAKRVAD